MNVFLDVDGVLADLGTPWLRRYNRDYDDVLTVYDLTSWNILEFVKPECGSKIFDYIEDPTIYDDVLPISEFVSKNVIGWLRDKGHKVIFATSSTNGCAGRKLRWLIDYGFTEKQIHQKDYIEISDKGLLDPSGVLIDDGYHNVKAYKGYGILYTQHHNLKDKWTPRIYSLINLTDGGLRGKFE